MKTTKKRVLGFTIGLMAENTRGGGTKESSMVWARTLIAQKTASSSGYGRQASALSGLTSLAFSRSTRNAWIRACSSSIIFSRAPLRLKLMLLL
jgi:hypothetical protein